MGLRKRQSADAIKEARKSEYFAKLRNVPSSPRKMRLVVDMIIQGPGHPQILQQGSFQKG